MRLGGERLGAQESVSKCLQCENEWSTVLGRRGGPFTAPQENLAIGVSKTQTCLVRDLVAKELGWVGYVQIRGRTCPGNASGIRPRRRICLVNSEKG
jgi:hypothetical protein